MTAVDAPDPKTFDSWSDAFRYPIPAVRRMEQELRADLATNREKLRNLVGSNYRDLLGTAEKIVDMDRSMRQVEANLGRVSEACNTRLIETKARNFRRWKQAAGIEDRQRLGLGSLLAIFQTCPLVISRLLRKPDAPLLAAKVLVISRRIHRSLAQAPLGRGLVEEVHDQLASLRRRLLRHLDHQLAAPDLAVDRLVQLLSAFSLATSSSLTDVLKHFHHVRLVAITSGVDQGQLGQSAVVQAFALYAQTLRDTRAVLPRPMMESLSSLKTRPLLQDGEVRALVELNLDVHEAWIPEDIGHFTPWIGHDDLQKSEAERMLLEWAKRAFGGLLQGLRSFLGSMDDFQALVEVRTEILSRWFESQHRVPGLTAEEPLQALREVIRQRLLHLVEAKARRLHLVGSEMVGSLQDWKEGMTDAREGLWDASTLSMDLGSGAARFKQAVTDRSHGRSDAVLRVLATYRAWLKPIEAVGKALKQMKEQKWDEDLDDDDDELGLETRNAQLSEDDPATVQREFHQALKTAFEELEKVLDRTDLTEKREGSQARFLLRCLRDIRRQLPPEIDISSFALRLVPRYHAVLAHDTSVTCLDGYRIFLRDRMFRSRPPTTLWEGSPALPIQPSVGVFSLLRSLMTAMARDADLWSQTAVEHLKGVMLEGVVGVIGPVLATGVPPMTLNGASHEVEDESHTSTAGGADEQAWKIEAMKQLLFDLLLLSTVFSTDKERSTTAADSTEEKRTSLVQQVRELANMSGTPSDLDRLQRNADECWKRTGQLFALLL